MNEQHPIRIDRKREGAGFRSAATPIYRADGTVTYACVAFRFDRLTDDMRESVQPTYESALRWCSAAAKMEHPQHKEVWK